MSRNSNVKHYTKFDISDVKTLIQKIKILGEIARESGATTRCFVLDLNALDCRKGCNVCELEKMAKDLTDGFANMKNGPGKSLKIRS